MTSVKYTILSFIVTTSAYYIADRWFNFLESFNLDIIPDYLNVIDVLLFSAVGIASAFLLRKSRKDKKQPLTEEQKHLVESKISHSNDLKKLYDRITSIRAEKNSQNNLIFTVAPPMTYNPDKNTDLEATRKRILERDDQLKGSWTSIHAMTDISYILQHLEDKEYKNINKYWKKANKLLKKYNKNNKEETKSKVDETLQSFRQELLSLVDRLNNDHIMKGKCDSCP